MLLGGWEGLGMGGHCRRLWGAHWCGRVDVCSDAVGRGWQRPENHTAQAHTHVRTHVHILLVLMEDSRAPLGPWCCASGPFPGHTKREADIHWLHWAPS